MFRGLPAKQLVGLVTLMILNKCALISSVRLQYVASCYQCFVFSETIEVVSREQDPDLELQLWGCGERQT